MTTTAVRLARAAVVALLGPVLLLTPAGPAGAAGTGGIEVTPIPGIVDGKQVTAFDVDADGQPHDVAYALRNITSTPKTARLYAASATRQPDGGFTVGDAGSSPFLVLPDENVTLNPGAFLRRTFRLRGEVQELTYGAVVVEVRNGSVVTRAATLVYLRPGRSVSIPLALGLLAGVLVLSAGFAVVLVRRRRRPVADPVNAEGPAS